MRDVLIRARHGETQFPFVSRPIKLKYSDPSKLERKTKQYGYKSYSLSTFLIIFFYLYIRRLVKETIDIFVSHFSFCCWKISSCSLVIKNMAATLASLVNVGVKQFCGLHEFSRWFVIYLVRSKYTNSKGVLNSWRLRCRPHETAQPFQWRRKKESTVLISSFPKASLHAATTTAEPFFVRLR